MNRVRVPNESSYEPPRFQSNLTRLVTRMSLTTMGITLKSRELSIIYKPLQGNDFFDLWRHIYIYIYIYIYIQKERERERERERKRGGENPLQPIFIVQPVQRYEIVQNYMKRFHILYEIYGKSIIIKRFIGLQGKSFATHIYCITGASL